MNKLIRSRFFYAAIFFLYGLVILWFILIPAFGDTVLKGKSAKLAILLPAASFVIGVLALVVKREQLDKRVDKIINEWKERFLNRYLFSIFGSLFLMMPVVLFTTSLHDIHICDAIWPAAWIISVVAAAIVAWFCLRGLREEYFSWWVVVLFCLFGAGPAYGFFILLFKLVAFWADCTSAH